MRKQKVIGISISDIDIPTFVSTVLLKYNSFNNICVSATGAHGIISATKDKNLFNVLNSFQYNLPDGMPSVWVSRLKGAKNIQRCFGPFVFKEIMKCTANKNIKHYFCGGKDGVADRLIESCKNQFSNENIVGAYSPPFRELLEDEIKIMAENINQKGTDILWIGISTPKQEILAKRLSKYTNVKMIVTVGAAFDYYTGSITIAPVWMQNLGLEWLFRLCLEPKRLWKRYLEIVPKFIIYAILDLMNCYKHPFKMKGE
jgi:N-acetylglucosaminyldiphosphoundecaprenol N-acetyl-beta-D-mannosaminyltransferase